MPLKIFLDVIEFGNYGLLRKSGRLHKNDKFALNIWGDILLEFSELDGNMTIKNNFDRIISIRLLQNSYTTIKAMIRLLYYATPHDPKHQESCLNTIEDLRKMGYIVDIADADSYFKSLLVIDKRCNSLITIIRMKQNELNGEHEEQDVSIDALLAMLQLHFHDIKEDITVKKYLACKKIIKARETPKKVN